MRLLVSQPTITGLSSALITRLHALPDLVLPARAAHFAFWLSKDFFFVFADTAFVAQPGLWIVGNSVTHRAQPHLLDPLITNRFLSWRRRYVDLAALPASPEIHPMTRRLPSGNRNPMKNMPPRNTPSPFLSCNHAHLQAKTEIHDSRIRTCICGRPPSCQLLYATSGEIRCRPVRQQQPRRS